MNEKKKKELRPHPDKTASQKAKLSFYPMTFDEAVTDILKVKPEPKKAKKPTKKKATPSPPVGKDK